MKISASMMCAKIHQLPQVLRIFEEEGIDYLHIDVMDGVFVPNYTLGTDYIRQLRELTSIPLDIHLMVEDPDAKLEWFGILPGEFVAVHAECCRHLQRTLQHIRALGGRPALVLNPATGPEVLAYLLDDLEAVTVMTVNPGFAGQKAVPAAVEKIGHVRRYLNERGRENIHLSVDGNVSYQLAPKMRSLGADILVAGSSSFFGPTDGLQEGIRRFRQVLTD
ncbi:ribulose-phosphate 3-epimerase [Harryflintia acetispora]|uniref:ribulose-phosphate 3-epimerase n=1 Tax=Harryflintia acetispora TaxID=1849041 RepID=UPI0018992B05|nr:ribulose-phosphate 3-epimerase [Harryflintia acetispora]